METTFAVAVEYHKGVSKVQVRQEVICDRQEGTQQGFGDTSSDKINYM